jgi:diguanylate cyclase (GGDEF)-like protein/PAS domain S-box-containing protein
MPDTSLSSLFEFLPIGAYRSTPGGVQLRANAALVRLNGYASEPDMLAATQALDQGWYVEPNRRATFKSLMEAQGAVVNFVSEVYRHKTRERIWIRENAYAVRDEAGQVLYYEGTVEDVSDSMRAQQALADSEARWRLALEAAGDGVWDWNIATGQETCSDGLLRMFGYEPGELPNDLSALDVRTHPDDRAQMAVDRDAHLTGSSPAYVNEHRVQCKNGEWKWVLSRGMVVARNRDGQPLRMIGTHTDISGRKRAETLIWQQANFDALTGLPNRRMLRQQLDVSLLRAAQHGRPVAVAFIDLDHFKEVNDTLGHDFGDMLLVQAAQRIRQATASSDTVARMGGDEFTVVVSDITAGDHMGDELSQRLAALLDALSQGFELRGQTVFVSASIGVALYPTDATQVEDLFKHADQALYSAKGAGRNRFCFFTPSLQVAAQQRARLDADLRLALPLQQLEVVYQPIVDMATGQVRKAEALLRWHHPVLGPVSPVQFIPIAETSGLIIPLGDWVFAQAVEQVAAWRQRFDAAFQISVNKSPVQFHRKASHAHNWARQLAQRGMPGSAIAIEITEGLLLDTSPLVTDHLTELRQAGIDVSLDDFGTGYSSLTYLQKLAIDYIKIDQSFVRNLQPGSTALSLCKAIIVMAHELGMRVVAEGVETEMQRDLLLQAGCDHGQGYLFARPMSPAVFEKWMDDIDSKQSPT